MSADLTAWHGVPRPERVVLEGRYARLEPLDVAQHGHDLFRVAGEDVDRFRYLFSSPPTDRADSDARLSQAAAGEDPLWFAVIDQATGRAEGHQSLMRIDPVHGVIEIGGIHWGPAMARSRVATEALVLFANYIFDLGYRRFEWKCNDANEPSKKAALRFGFKPEGVFRQHMVVKGENRDTAWFSILDREWPAQRARFAAWLDPANFDEAGRQKAALARA